jgi:hypothetical protein
MGSSRVVPGAAPAVTYYRLHGLTVCSDLDLGARVVNDPQPLHPDLTFSRAETRPVPMAPPPGRIIVASPASDDGPSATFVSSDPGPVIRFHGQCEFAFSADRTRVTWWVHPGVSEEEASIKASGAVLATTLILGGHLVLHASAVAVDGRAVAFVAHSNSGKSTLATLLCRSGAQLVSDDVLRIRGGSCFTGATETRLRVGAALLAEGERVRGRRRTVDGRLATKLDLCRADQLPLGAIVVPKPDREVRWVSAEPARGASAALVLAQFLRVRAWRDTTYAARQLDEVADLAANVPVWRCRLPWGPPFHRNLVPDLLESIEIGAVPALPSMLS